MSKTDEELVTFVQGFTDWEEAKRNLSPRDLKRVEIIIANQIEDKRIERERRMKQRGQFFPKSNAPRTTDKPLLRPDGRGVKR